jgi:hypothetical protein
MNVEIVAEAALFLEKEYINRNAVAVHYTVNGKRHPYFCELGYRLKSLLINTVYIEPELGCKPVSKKIRR